MKIPFLTNKEIQSLEILKESNLEELTDREIWLLSKSGSDL
ncbi:MAG: hypothetical protein ABID38_00820 [Candidatus Diapherotrites archaeon]